jgi:pimeloyl-ACP methyl ester carboxylesterase
VPEIELSTGIIDYEDTGGAGPPIVLLHGLLMDATLWDDVVTELVPDHRCVVPTLPLGAHRHTVSEAADLSLRRVAAVVTELLTRLDLSDVTLVGNDTGGALVQFAVGIDAGRIGAIVLASCDAFDNFPPGLTGKTLVATSHLPTPLFGAFMQQLRIRPVRRLPIAFGWLTRRGDAATKRWVRALLASPAIRRDARRLLRGAAKEAHALHDASEALANFDRPALVVWASEDRVMPPDHGRRLASVLPNGELVEIADSDTLLPLDQPAALADAIRTFVAAKTVVVPDPDQAGR